MDIMKAINKGPIMDTKENFHICSAKKEGMQLNDTHIYRQQNPRFEIIHTCYNRDTPA
jgi:hypothetical protein